METIVIEEKDDKLDLGIKFYNENVERLVQQCKTKNNAISYLITYSFLEGYFRERFPSKFSFKINNKISFPMMIESFVRYNNSLERSGKSETSLLLIDIKYLYSYWNKKEWNSSENTDANHIRHCFANVRDGELYCLLKRMRDFLHLQYIDTKEIDDLLNDSSIFEDKAAAKFLNYFSGSQEDFFEKYPSYIQYKKYKSIINSNLSEYILNTHEKSQFGRDYEILKHYSIHALSNEREFFSYDNYFNNLKASLDQEITGRDYAKELRNGFILNQQQKQIVDICYENLMNKNNIIIEGAPGTGKTLLLISSLFVLNKKHDGKPLLLTFSSSLEKYNEYLCQVFNDDGFLKQFDIKEYKKESISDFVSNHVQSFYSWIKDTLPEYIKKDIYSINKKNKSSLDLKQKEINLISDKIYEKLTTEIWPNLLDLDPIQDKQILQFHETLDKQKRIPDLYAFWKFAKYFDDDELQRASTNRPDFILLDEVQDLTRAQLQTANKISAKGCMLAGDINQSIKNTCSSWSDLGIEPVNTNLFIKLTHNYRMSFNIEKFGKNYLNLCNDMELESFSTNGTEIAGPTPQLYVKQYNSPISIYEQVTNSVKMLHQVCKKDFKDIFIVTTTNSELNEMEKALKNYQKTILPFKIEKLKEKEAYTANYKDKDIIHLGTIESIKGIDCPIVLLLISCDILTKPNIQNSLYSVMNRAMHLLQVFMPIEVIKIGNKYIKNFVNLLRNGNHTENNIPTHWHRFYPKKVNKLKDQSIILEGELEDGSYGSIKENILQEKLSLVANEAKNYKEIIVTIQGKLGDKGYYLSPEYISIE